MSFNVLYSIFVDPKSITSNGEENLELDININRFRLHRGFSVSAYSKEFQWKRQSFSLGLKYWYSIPEKGGWLNASIKWHIKPHLVFKSGIDILGRDSSSAQKSSFFSLYNQNDRLTFQVIYSIK